MEETCSLCGQAGNPHSSWDREIVNGRHPICEDNRLRDQDNANKPDEKVLKATIRGNGPPLVWEDAPGLRISRGTSLPHPKLPWSFKGMSFLKPYGDNWRKGRQCDGSRTMRLYERLAGEAWWEAGKEKGFRTGNVPSES